MNQRANADIGVGRRIFNVPPTDSRLIAGRSARPGDPGFDQDFASGNSGLVRTNTQTGNEPRAKGRNAHFEYGTDQHGRTVNNPGAFRSSEQNFASAGGVRDTAPDIGGYNSRLNRSNAHQLSGQSLIGSSTEILPGATNTFKPQRTASKLEDSTAAPGRPPAHIQGLTEFLRREYYRRMGIYLNGSQKEEGLLLNFWKDHVSEAYKALNEEKKKQMKEDAKIRREYEMSVLKETDPNAYRRIQNEKEAKERAKFEKMERE